MCSWTDDGDRTFEEESRRRNQDALSASNGLALDLRAATSEFNCEGGGGMKGVGWKTEKGKSISGKVALGGFKNRMHPLLISKRKSCLKSGCLAVLAANATSRLRDEILFSEELRGVIGTYRNPPCDKNPVAKCFPLDVYAEFIYYNLIFLNVFR